MRYARSCSSGLVKSELACESCVLGSALCAIFIQLIATLDCNDDHEMINAEEFEVVLRRHMDKG